MTTAISALSRLELKTELLALLSAATAVAAADDALPVITVLAERRGDSVADMPGWTLAEWDSQDISASAPPTLDQLLAQDPSFSF